MADIPTLPTTQHLLTSLISTIATATDHNKNQDGTSNSNPLGNITDTNTKSAILTLHTLFPDDFLPALDLLDRGLVTRFILAPSPPPSPPPSENPEMPGSLPPNKNTPSSRSRTHTSAADTRPQTSYSIHLNAWNCSCPAFAFSAFPATTPDDAFARAAEDEECPTDESVETAWRFGGLTRAARDGVPPVCKHLLACVVAERWEGFGALVVERGVGGDEVAGWAAGWGE
ncbi:hypothetical protein Q7P37_010595 [Cladosporium fusiforme]